MLSVVHEQVAYPLPFPGEQARITFEFHERAGDQLGRVERGSARLTHRVSADSLQQGHLLVLAPEMPGRHPLGPALPAAQRDEVLGPQTAFGGAQQQIT